MLVYSKEQIRYIEKSCIEAGYTEKRMIENAGAFLASEINHIVENKDKIITVVCGKGNNGADGFVTARKLMGYGFRVVIILPDGPPAEGECAEMFALTQEVGINTIDFRSQPEKCRLALEQSQVIVDAIYGIGFHGELPARCDLLCRIINSSKALVVSADVPSGIECDTAHVARNAVKADITVSSFGYKSCFVLYPATDYCGKIIITDIGIPEICKLDSNYKLLSEDMVQGMLPMRAEFAHKGTFGRVGMYCGSFGMTGAAVLSAQAAYRSGCGLVKVVTEDRAYPIIAQSVPEAVFSSYDENTSPEVIYNDLSEFDVVLIGCGIEKSNRNTFLLRKLVTEFEKTLVIDATALRILAENMEVLENKKCNIVLTPHVGELADLCSVSIEEIEKNRLFYANQLARKYKVTVVEKGAHTIIHCLNGSIYANMTGNSGLATAGSGDVLAGTIASLCAQGLEQDDAASVGVYVHGLSADMYAKTNSSRTLVASDLIERYKKAFNSVE